MERVKRANDEKEQKEREKREKAEQRKRKKEEKQKQEEARKKAPSKRPRKSHSPSPDIGKCPNCAAPYDMDDEVWLQCEECSIWSHKDCAGYKDWTEDDLESEVFICDNCIQ